ncbi:hypothetical protein CL656_03875 [bacterium]|nr:hypothetical protein [bacterium]|tara:strand:- start:2830 stop:4530 length:1701 start_codon:yes stop_codon:yes gene_type:complete
MLSNFFSKKILESQIVKVPLELDSINAISDFAIDFENNYQNRKKLPIYIYFKKDHPILNLPIHFNILYRRLMDANCFFKFYFEALPVNLKFAYLPNKSFEIKDYIKEESAVEKSDQDFQVNKIGDKPLNNVEIELDELRDKFKRLFISKDIESNSYSKIIKYVLSSFLIIFSIGVLSLAVFHINPTININFKPASTSIEQVLNIALVDKNIEDQEIDDYLLNRLELFDVKLEKVVHKSNFSSTGKNFTGENAKGEIEVVNTSGKTYNFVPYTRFQTQSGLIFRSQESVEILPGSLKQPYKTKVLVQADTLDLLGNPVGDLGNIPVNTRLNVPGLNQSSQKSIYATTVQDFTGGTTQVEKFVLDSDLKSAEVFLLNDLKSKIPDLFESYLEESFEKNNIQLEILNFDEAIELKNIEYIIDQNLIGQKTDGFQGEIKADIYAKSISKKDLENIAKMQLEKSVAPYNNLDFIDFPDMTYRLSRLPLNPKVQILTLVVKGVQTFDLNKHPDFTIDSVTKVLENQKGVLPNTLEEFFRNQEAIAQSKIEISPFWRKSIPSNIKNVEINYEK